MKFDEIFPVPNIKLKAVEKSTDDLSELVFEFSDNLKVAYPTGKKLGAVTVIPADTKKATFIVSLGEKKKVDINKFRLAAAAFSRWCNSHSVEQVSFDPDQPSVVSDLSTTRAILEGLAIGGFEFNRYKTRDITKRTQTSILAYGKKELHLEQEVLRASILGESVDMARDWIHEPANNINPQTLAERCEIIAKQFGLEYKVVQFDELVSMGAGGLTAVGRGSQTKPRLISIGYKGNGDASPVVLVGKAITFDTGGYSLKPSDFIQGMKYDKAGGVSVLATVIAAARLKLKTNVVAVIPAAENMISAEAYRPDDILKLLSGLTVEIVSTDAEGRLILADALTYTQREYHPKAIIDIATLTGGVKVALGTFRAGLLSNSDNMADLVFKAGETTGEKLWRLPMDEEYFELLKSDDADMKNSGPREASTIIGGIFLKQAVSDDIPWAHVDIAATGDVDSEKPWCGKGPTGFGVRLMFEALEKLS